MKFQTYSWARVSNWFLILGVLLALGACDSSSSSTNYDVNVKVSGLKGGTLVLQLNGTDNLTFTRDGTANFTTQAAADAAVTVATNPVLQKCGAGNFSAGDTTLFVRVRCDNILFYSYDEEDADGVSVQGAEPWISDGTPAGTMLLKNITADAVDLPGSTSVGGLMVAGNYGYFNDFSNVDCYRTDGTTAGTEIFISGGYCTNPFVAGDYLFFDNFSNLTKVALTANLPVTPVDVQTADTVPVVPSSTSNVTVLNGKLLFRAFSPLGGSELWSTDGTDANTFQVKDIYADALSSSPSILSVVGDKLFFSATSLSEGRELWVTDGTQTGTTLVKDISPGTDISTNPLSSSPSSANEFIGKLIFRATTPETGTELWVSDGTEAGTMMLGDLNPGASGSSIYQRARRGDSMYFTSNDAYGQQLFRTDGATIEQMTFDPYGAGFGTLNVLNGDFVFTYQDFFELLASPTCGLTGLECNVQPYTVLHTSDGASGEITPLFADPSKGPILADDWGFSVVSYPNQAGNNVFFTGWTVANGVELWVSDGTEAGTTKLEMTSGTYGSDMGILSRLGDKVLLYRYNQTTNPTGTDWSNPWEYWVSDGTAEGTVALQSSCGGSCTYDTITDAPYPY